MALCFVIRLLSTSAVFIAISSAVQAQNDLSGFSVLPSSITIKISLPARFDCQTNITNGFIRWARGSNPMMITANNCRGCVLLLNYSLYISSVDRSHTGVYTCFIVGVALQPRFSVHLTIAGDGQWGPFGSWSSCSKTCGGIRTRQRECNNPPPSNGGADCKGKEIDQRSCNENACPGWGSWTNWSSCSATCGGGQRTRSRFCTPSNGVSDCHGDMEQRAVCNNISCLVNGGWGSWTAWSQCYTTCGGGQQTRQRLCNNPPPSGGGSNCPGSGTQQQICATLVCPGFLVLPSNITTRIALPARFDCQTNITNGFIRWARESNFMMITESNCRGCVMLSNSSLYISSVDQSHSGVYTCFIVGLSSQPRFSVHLTIAVDGQWGPFSSWSSCSKSCGGGKRTKQRECNNPPPSNGGLDCKGRAVRRRSCNKDPCPVNGKWGKWTVWSTCSQTCDGGIRSRQRTCDNPPPSNGGKDCKGKEIDQRKCNRKACSEWGSWSSCSVTCGGGLRTRHLCMDLEDKDNCSGMAEEETCNSFSCPVDGGWSSWTNWTSCFVKCYRSPCTEMCGGQRIRQRFCNTPIPWQGGNYCFGNSRQQEACNTSYTTSSLIDDQQFEDDSSENQIQALCYFDMGGVSGTVSLLQRQHNSTHLFATFDRLDKLPGNGKYGLYVTKYPTRLNQVNPCATASVGDIYNPEGIDTSLPDYSSRCMEDHKECAVGDLATRHDPLSGSDSGVFAEFTDANLDLYGPNTVVWHALTLKRVDTNEVISCCNIQVPTTRILQSQFNDRVFSGEISIVQPQYDTVNYTRIENIITVDLKRIDGGPANIPKLAWQLQPGFANKTCSHLTPILGRQSTNCSETQHCACPVGDLTAKCGPLQLADNRIQAQCVDEQLILGLPSALNNFVVSISDQNTTILDCSQLSEQLPIEAYVNFQFEGGFVNLRFSQLSPYSPTMYYTYVVGLNGQAGNIVVYDGMDCSNLGNILDYPGRLPVANPITSDEYPVGELGPKIGGVVGRNYLRNEGSSSNIPLTGEVNILDKPIALLSEEGHVLGCGLVKNAPY